MISESVQTDIGMKFVDLVLHKYLDRSDLQPINFTWWIYQRLGKGNRWVIPSCVLWCIRSVYEERDGVYVKYQEGDRD